MPKKKQPRLQEFGCNPHNVWILEQLFNLVQQDPLFPALKELFVKVAESPEQVDTIDDTLDSRIITWINVFQGFIAENYSEPNGDDLSARLRREMAEEFFYCCCLNDRRIIENMKLQLRQATQ